MKTLIYIGTFVILFASALSFAKSPNKELLETVKEKTAKKQAPLRLRNFDIRTQALSKEEFKETGLRSNFVYGVFVEKYQQWMLTHTNKYGKLHDPLRVIRVQSVLPAAFFGVNKKGNYLYTQTEAWTRTFKPDFRFYWVMDEKEYILTEAFNPPKTALNKTQLLRKLASIFKDEKKPKKQPKPLLVNYLGKAESAEKLLPKRVYYRYFSDIGNWYYSLTDSEGKFDDPAEVLMPGTVLRGEYFRLPNTERRQLLKNDSWVAIKYWPRTKALVFADSPYVHYSTYVTPRKGARPIK